MTIINRLLYSLGFKKKTRCISSTCLHRRRVNAGVCDGTILICSIIHRPLEVNWFVEDCSDYMALEELYEKTRRVV